MERKDRVRFGGILAIAALAACAPADEVIDRQEGREGLRGLEVEEPWPAPAFTLSSSEGRPYDFPEATSGRLALVFFGYTSCPDICPVQMAILDAALEDLSYAERRRIEVIFVTTDPERDTPERLREWLDRLDTSFVGLHGELDRVNDVLAGFQLPPAMIERPHMDGPAPTASAEEGYTVGHATPIIAVTGDGLVRALYPSGVRQTDWQHDLPRLLALDAASAAGIADDDAGPE